ncbi:MAG: DUF4124 domain-containing protein [Candidatus Thiodiazotropha sp. (ex Lucinoma borealis)]|nr:DUF4124 domain-containing protein [Candidatus Thiodiazotropha sp. (ex Lucinoma borealis)]
MECCTLSMAQKPVTFTVFSLFLFFALLLGTYQLEAGVYKWTDEQGRVQFSDRPVTGESTEVKIKNHSPSPVQNEQDRKLKTRRMLDVYKEDRAAKKEASQKQKEEKKKRKKNCVRAKDQYASHSRASGIYDFGKDGDRRYLSDEQRNRHMKNLKAEISRWCK